MQVQNPQIRKISLTRRFKRLIVYLFTRGTSTFIIILGRRESGKTDISLLITEILNYSHTYSLFASNIKVFNSPFKIGHITNLPDLEEWASSSKGQKLYILDEAGKAFRRRTPMSKLNIELIDKLQTLRKYQLSFIFIAPHEKYIDGAGLGSDVLDGVFVKPFFKNPHVALYEDKLEAFDFTLKDIPPTSLKFDTWDIAPFTLKRPLSKPEYPDEKLNQLWELSHGKSGEALGLHPQEVSRLWKNFVKTTLESSYHPSQA